MEISPIEFNTFCNKIMLETAHEKVMKLSIFIDSEDDKLKQIYKEAVKKHNDKIMNDVNFYDAGFDLYLPTNETDQKCFSTGTNFFRERWDLNIPVAKVDFKVKCCAQMYSNNDKYYYTPFYTYMRSSMSKTPLRLANNQGIIDAGYRGNLIGMFDCIYKINKHYSQSYHMDAYSRMLQICAPGLVPIYVNVVDSLEQLGPSTSRGEGGFGSTGN